MKLIIVSSLFFLSLFAQAFTVPEQTGPVVDQSGLLSKEQQYELSDKLRTIKNSGGEQIQVLIVPSLDGEVIEQATIKVFDQWKLGDEKKDDGVLLMISTGDKKLRIEVGRGLEGQIPDLIAKRIIVEITRPLFQAKNYYLGVALTAEAIHQAATTSQDKVFSIDQFKSQYSQNLPARTRYQTSEVSDSNEKKLSTTKVFLFLFVLWIIVLIFSPSTALWILYALLSGGRGGGGGYRGGGGGWSGGGGSSAGGGASGDW